jgi:hypothetical protein
VRRSDGLAADGGGMMEIFELELRRELIQS